MTSEQVRNRTKTVTRRTGWWLDKNGKHIIRPGDRIQPIEKGMGLKKGEKQVRIGGLITVIDVRRELLCNITRAEIAKEGYPKMEWLEFVQRFCRANRCRADAEVTRIEFKYV